MCQGMLLPRASLGPTLLLLRRQGQGCCCCGGKGGAMR